MKIIIKKYEEVFDRISVKVTLANSWRKTGCIQKIYKQART